MTLAKTIRGTWLFLVLALLAVTGCTVTATTTTPGPTCGQDASVTGCVGGATGYSCTGGDTPDQSDSHLLCSTGTVTTDATLFCCVTFATTITTSCQSDSTVSGCAGASIGFSCTGTDAPQQADPSLNCSTGVAGNAGSTLYCCAPATTTASCGSDGTVSGCVGGASGYSCTGTDTPDQSDATLLCSSGTAGNAGSTLFCCVTFATTVTTSCAADATVTGCVTSSIGFSCTGTDTPQQADASLNCSTGVAGNAGSTLYCCATAASTTAGSCAANTALTCVTGASGYSCTGTATPDATALLCSEPAAGAGTLDYCCLQLAAGTPTCAQDQTVSCPQQAGTAVSYGFSCTSTDTPASATEYPGLNCSTGVAGNAGSTLYCCQ